MFDPLLQMVTNAPTVAAATAPTRQVAQYKSTAVVNPASQRRSCLLGNVAEILASLTVYLTAYGQLPTQCSMDCSGGKR